MFAEELAKELLKNPKALVLLKVGEDWVEVCGVAATGEHRNGVTLQVQNPALNGGVIVVERDIWPAS